MIKKSLMSSLHTPQKAHTNNLCLVVIIFCYVPAVAFLRQRRIVHFNPISTLVMCIITTITKKKIAAAGEPWRERETKAF